MLKITFGMSLFFLFFSKQIFNKHFLSLIISAVECMNHLSFKKQRNTIYDDDDDDVALEHATLHFYYNFYRLL